MSMTMDVSGYRTRDEEWARMLAIFELCDQAGIAAPAEVLDFFGDLDPEEAKEAPGAPVDIDEACEWSESECCCVVDLKKLPANLRYIRAWMLA